ncbi:MAG TPA: His/Gly/Thr/Pro-type tRNA ligase C-terminal domain-containing protein [bacterium]|nr:His/Gly/Thr/Pro-type tRNA ligase C-terminal domain-containing protein [bacterium]
MLWTNYLLPTQKEVRIEGEDTASLRLTLQAGLIRQLASGIYTFLPFGLAVLRRIEDVVREEMNRAGAVELLMPALQPTSLWKESDRYQLLGKDIVSFSFKDRHDRELLLGPTHEEVIVDVARHEILSYRQLPITLYQIQTKFRDEMRPRFGLVRGREFLMKDAYSFDTDTDGLDVSYQKMSEAYHRIFRRLRIKYHTDQADSGAMGGKFSEEFVAEGECPELEIGHLFKLGTAYSEKMRAVFLDEQGRQRPFVMGCYGIGVSRLIAAVIENNFDADGIIWPIPVAPFRLHLIPLNYGQPNIKAMADRIYQSALEAGLPVLMDNRDRSAGEKFKDADLVGIPYQVVIGKRAVEGKIDFRIRRTREQITMAPEEVVAKILAFPAE